MPETQFNKRVVARIYSKTEFHAIIIICIDLPGLPWFIEGGVVSFALALPIAVLVSENDKKSVPIILSTSIILGIIISVVGNYLK